MRLKLKYLPPKELRVDPKNKELFDALNPQELEFLARSIQEHGLINPITITEDHLIIAGEQRYRAAVQLGLEQVPVIIRKPKDDLELEEIRIDENLLRRSLPTWTIKQCFDRKVEIKLTRRSASSVEQTMTPNQLMGEVNREIAAETGYSIQQIKNIRSLERLIPELLELLKENHFNQEVALQLAQLSKDDQGWVLSRLSASRLKEVRFDEMKNLKTQLHNVQDTNAKLQELIESRDKETDKEIKKRVAAEIQTARDAVAEAKQQAKDQVEAIREQYATRQKKIDEHYRDQLRHPITRFLQNSVTLLHTKPEVAADNYWLISYDLAEMICDKADALSPWLITFAKALRTRIRSERRSNLKEVK